MKVWITSNVTAWTLEECELANDVSVAAVARWMNAPDSRNPSVIRWLGDGVTGDYTVGRTSVTVQWRYLGDGAGQVCTGIEDNLETIAFICKGRDSCLENQNWQVLTGEATLPSKRPLIVLAHKQAIKDGQHRLGKAGTSPSVSLALAYAFAFLAQDD
jgi:hypothetical protein